MTAEWVWAGLMLVLIFLVLLLVGCEWLNMSDPEHEATLDNAKCRVWVQHDLCVCMDVRVGVDRARSWAFVAPDRVCR